jgi:hypothetical protein
MPGLTIQGMYGVSPAHVPRKSESTVRFFYPLSYSKGILELFHTSDTEVSLEYDP